MSVLARSDVADLVDVHLSSPFTFLDGDECEIEGTTAYIVRNGVRVDARLITSFTPHPTETFQGVSSVSTLTLYKVKAMPGVAATLTDVVESGPGGTITFKFASGTQLEFENWAAVESFANGFDANQSIPEGLLITRSFRRSPDGENKVNSVGAVCSVDGSSNTLVQFTE